MRHGIGRPRECIQMFLSTRKMARFQPTKSATRLWVEKHYDRFLNAVASFFRWEFKDYLICIWKSKSWRFFIDERVWSHWTCRLDNRGVKIKIRHLPRFVRPFTGYSNDKTTPTLLRNQTNHHPNGLHNNLGHQDAAVRAQYIGPCKVKCSF